MIKVTLPFPPSVNGLFGGGSNQKRFKSKAYKEWLASCPQLFKYEIYTPIYISYIFYSRDKRKRDLSNYIKAPEDYLVAQKVIQDDNWETVARISAEYGGIDKHDPRVEIMIYPLDAGI